MKFTILGSGGAINTPRALCQCRVCKEARAKGVPYSRNGPSLFIEDINAIIDTPEDIGISINRENIKKIDNIFITHWHPDHTFGIRLVLEACYDWVNHKAGKRINLYVPKKVYNELAKKYPAIEYHRKVTKLANVILLDNKQKVRIKNTDITPVGYNGKASETFGYLIEQSKKRVFYSPCDTMGFDQFDEIKDLDLWITEVGIWRYSDPQPEILHGDVIKRILKVKPKKAVLVHIEEVDRNGFDDLKKLEKSHKNIIFAYDGMKIRV